MILSNGQIMSLFSILTETGFQEGKTVELLSQDEIGDIIVLMDDGFFPPTRHKLFKAGGREWLDPKPVLPTATREEEETEDEMLDMGGRPPGKT